MVALEVTQNTKGISPADPEIRTPVLAEREEIIIKGFDNSTNTQRLVIEFPEALAGQEITVAIMNKNGKAEQTEKMVLRKTTVRIKCPALSDSQYHVIISGKHNVILEQDVKTK